MTRRPRPPIDELDNLLHDLPLGRVAMWLRYFRPGRCRYCGEWTWFILRSEGMHEDCWLELK